VPRSA
jgi:SAM-dependent methyltransferase